MPPKQIFLLGYYGAGNLGDELILQNILSAVPKDFKVVVCGRGSQAPVKLSLFNFPQIFWKIKKSSHVVIGGGDIFQELTSPRSIQAASLISRIAKFFKKKLILLGVSAGPVFSGAGMAAMKKIARWSDLIIVRDEASFDFFKKLAPANEKIILGADLSFFSPVPAVAPKKFIRDFPEQKIIGLSLRDWFEEKKEKSEKLKLLARLFGDAMLNHEFKLVLLPFQFEKDKLVEEKFLEQMRHPEKCITYDAPISIEKMWQIIWGLDALIGTRFHSLVMAAQAVKPILSLGYAPKNEEFMKQLGLENFQISMKDFCPEKVDSILADFLNSGDLICKIIRKQIPDFFVRAIRSKQIFLGAL